jgi:HSP20 family protein
LNEGQEFLAAERPRGVFSRQLVLGDNLDLDHIQAGYRDGVLQLVIPVAERAKPRKISISHNGGGDQAITTGNGHNRENAADSNARNTVDADANTVNA